MPVRQARSTRVNRIGRKLARHWARLRDVQQFGKVPLGRRERNSKPRKLIAYDLETTRIEAGTPRPLYLTACTEDWRASVPIQSLEHLGMLLRTRFLTAENNRARFVAWNANGFDVYFIGQALLAYPEYILKPYLTRSKNLRGLKVTLREKVGKKTLTWEFLDGMAMTVGNAPMTLAKFLTVFAPDHGKLAAPDWERETFDAGNKAHVAYAERDSEGLYHGMVKAQGILLENFGVPLQPTIGNTAIRIFQANMPMGVFCWEPGFKVAGIIRTQVMRGGFCHIARKHEGPIWKYDLNQAYAAAMREAFLPGGRCYHVKGMSKYATCAIYRIRASHPVDSGLPFYYVDMQGDARFETREISETWLTSIETDQLRREGWRIEVIEGYAWEDAFSMREYVDKLERLRTSAVDGPNGALGTVVKSIGNNSYGKTVELLDGMELLLAKECPEGFNDYLGDDEEGIANVWFKFKPPQWREYHQPQIGAFITAHVRMVVRRAALLAPEAFIYADTDCVVFDSPVDLPVDPKRYGYWKTEESGRDYWIITKKVYAAKDGSASHAKGLNVKRLTTADFEGWFNGRSPRQRQVQRNNWLKVMMGAPMFNDREKVGQVMALDN